VANLKAIEILKTFSTIEFKQFEKFAASTFFSTGRNVAGLIKYLKILHPEYPEKKLEFEFINRKISPGGALSDDSLRMQFTALEHLCKSFLSVNHHLNSSRFDTNMLEELSARGLGSVFEKEIARAELNLQSRGNNNLRTLERIERIKKTFVERNGLYTRSLKHVSGIGDYKTTGFIIDYFKNLQDHMALRNTYMSSAPKDLAEKLFDLVNFDPIIELYRNSDIFGSELVLFYYNQIMFYASGGKKKYYTMMNGLAPAISIKYRDEINDVYRNLINCCWWAIKEGMREYEQGLFDLYNEILAKNQLPVLGAKYIEAVNFKNIFVLAVSLRKLDWAEGFLNEYRASLNPANGDEIIHHSFAFLYFYRGEFERSLKEINKVVFKDHVYKMDMQMLMLIIYYETNSLENILPLADTLGHFLRKHYDKFPRSRKVNLLFVKAIVQLAKLKQNFNEKGFNKLNGLIEKEALLPSRAWFIRKINEERKNIKKPA